MAEPTPPTGPAGEREPERAPLLGFLAEFERIVEVYATTVRGLVAEADSAAVIDGLSAVARTQARSLATFVGDAYRQSPPPVRSEVDLLFARLGGQELMQGGLAVAAKATSVQALLGINEIIELIKKIIKFILNLIFPKGAPPWIDELIEIIDEIIRAILGQRSQKAQHEANQNYIDFLQTMRALRQLQLLESGGRQEEAGG